MNISRHKLMKELEYFLNVYGISITKDEPTKRHRKVWVTDGTKTAMIVVSVSPSDHRAFMNMAKTARNALREAP